MSMKDAAVTAPTLVASVSKTTVAQPAATPNTAKALPAAPRPAAVADKR